MSPPSGDSQYFQEVSRFEIDVQQIGINVNELITDMQRKGPTVSTKIVLIELGNISRWLGALEQLIDEYKANAKIHSTSPDLVP